MLVIMCPYISQVAVNIRVSPVSYDKCSDAESWGLFYKVGSAEPGFLSLYEFHHINDIMIINIIYVLFNIFLLTSGFMLQIPFFFCIICLFFRTTWTTDVPASSFIMNILI